MYALRAGILHFVQDDGPGGFLANKHYPVPDPPHDMDHLAL